MKRKIRLTESDLHRVIRESVNKILTELDWKTYANAAKKANTLRDKRFCTFGQTANKHFNNEFGYRDGDKSVEGDVFLSRVSADNDDNHSIMRLYDYNPEDESYSNPYNYDYTKAFGLMDKYDTNGRYKRVRNPSLSKFFNNKDQESAYRRSSKEMDDYLTGKSKYEKGKGWQIESLNRKIDRIVSECLRRNIR